MFKFTIRDLLLLTVVAALAVGWWADHRSQAQKIRSFQSQAAKRVIERMNRMTAAEYRAQWVKVPPLPGDSPPGQNPPKD